MANKKVNQRDSRLDILRALAILLIVLAHIPNVPVSLKNFRTFDVPLMAILLGASYQITKGNSLGYCIYLKKRIKRLLIPTWTFLVIFFVQCF